MKVDSLPNFLSNNSNCLSEIGWVQDKYIVVEIDILLIISPPRRIPASLKSRLSKELTRTNEMKIITASF